MRKKIAFMLAVFLFMSVSAAEVKLSNTRIVCCDRWTSLVNVSEDAKPLRARVMLVALSPTEIRLNATFFTDSNGIAQVSYTPSAPGEIVLIKVYKNESPIYEAFIEVSSNPNQTPKTILGIPLEIFPFDVIALIYNLSLITIVLSAFLLVLLFVHVYYKRRGIDLFDIFRRKISLLLFWIKGRLLPIYATFKKLGKKQEQDLSSIRMRRAVLSTKQEKKIGGNTGKNP
ncbi:MAG: hypothetical protein QXP42_00980 [Candidatus Micrarchaeia archaeon]